MDFLSNYLENFLDNDHLFTIVTRSTISILVLVCIRFSSDASNNNHLETHDSSSGALLFLISLTVCISSFASLAVYLQHGTAIAKWAGEISSDDVFVSTIAVLSIALDVFVLVAEFQKKREGFVPIAARVGGQAEVAPLEVAVEEFVLCCVATTFGVGVEVFTLPGYGVEVLCGLVVSYVNGC